MDVVRAAFAVAVLAGLSLGATLVLAPGAHESQAQERDFAMVDGSLLTAKDLRSTATMAEYRDLPVIVLRLPAEALDEATYALSAKDPLDAELRLVAYDARSTHLGCAVQWEPEVVDGPWDLMDPCSQSLFNPYAQGLNREGMPAPRPLGGFDASWALHRGVTGLLLTPT